MKYKGKSIFDVLDMTVEEALPFFENVPYIRRKIETLYDVGLSYVKLGQPSTTLSGGEAQQLGHGIGHRRKAPLSGRAAGAPEVRAQALTLPVAATPNAPDRLLSVRGIFLALHSP